jgi:hypothetical protein
MKKRHGNNLDNDNTHHLYEIRDLQEQDVYKYGISDDPIDEDGLSSRLRDQLQMMNRIVGFLRFIGRILLTSIPGRRKARAIEDEHIQAYREQHGSNPRGNIRGGKAK